MPSSRAFAEELNKQVIEYVAPDLLVVANKKSARLIEERLGALWDDDRGEFSTSIAGKSVPVFLSGQWKYMDSYSRKHLHWRITRAVRTTRKPG